MTEIKIVELDNKEWNEAIKDWDLWYKRWVRAYVWERVIYIKKNARFLFAHSKEDLTLHEVGHLLGYKHRWFFGVMAFHGLWRL